MKTIIFLFVISSFAAVLAAAPLSANREKPTIVERGAHHRVWQSVQWRTNSAGKSVGQTNSYTELQSGLHYQKDGQWVETEAKIEITPTGASAGKGPHTVNFEGNINTIGAIELTTPDGKTLRSHVLGLSYFDTATGKSALIAEIHDSVGLLKPPNQIIYPDAFTDIKADIRYTYRKNSFEQDVILREQLPSPEEYGLNPASTRLEVLTEFIDPPAPAKTAKVIRDGTAQGIADERLDFGAMKVREGIAFLIGEGSPTNNTALGPRKSIPVGKKWARMEEREFLIESVNYDSVKTHLGTLPKAEAKANKAERVARIKASEKRMLPVKREARNKSEKIRVASVEQKQEGFLIDYETVTGSTDYTFKGDTTYFISGTVSIFGTITLEGGTVIKFDSAEEGGSDFYSEDGNFDCKTDAYRPAVFTDMNDDSVGEIIDGSTGTPTYWLGMAVVTGNPTISNARFFYGAWPMSVYDESSSVHLNNVQYVNCAIPVNLEGGGTATLRNVLMTRSLVPLRGYGEYKVFAENVTIVGADPSGMTGPEGDFVTFTNSIIVAVTNLGPATIITNNSLIDTNVIPGIFQTVGAAGYYLVDESPYRNAGTTNINTNLLASLRRQTTYPPIVIAGVFYTNNLTLSPQAQRDIDALDLGYHYDPLDYALGSVIFTNCAVTVSPGTAIATFSSVNTYGFTIQQSASIACMGEPNRLNYIVNYNTVQEQSNTNWVKADPISFYSSWGSGTAPSASFRFTEWSMLANVGSHFYSVSAHMPSVSFRDCQFYSGNFLGLGPSIYMTNNLLHRLSLSILYASEFKLWNNTVYGGVFNLNNEDDGTWRFYNNLFVYTTNLQSHAVSNDYNAFYSVPAALTPTGASNVVLTNLTFETGSLGNFYLGTNNIKLFNAGSVNATNIGLFHFMTTTNQVKETNSIVDIGFHYVALNNSNQPVDSDSDGLADYFEDSNGNGIYDTPDFSDYGDADTDNDGIDDYIEWLEGRNPKVGASTSSLPNLRVYTTLK